MNLACMLRDTQLTHLTAEEERELGRNMINNHCHDSREHLRRCNVQLVLDIADRYLDRGVHLFELVDRGLIGLNRAVDTFDPAIGYRFSTHAGWWIKSEIRNAICKPREQLSRSA